MPKQGYLVSQQVLLVVDRISGHLQAEDTQQEAGVSVEARKVLDDVRVEGGAIRTHLKATAELTRSHAEPARLHRSHSPGRCTASLLVCGWTSCGSRRPARSQTPTHKYDTYLRDRGGSVLSQVLSKGERFILHHVLH